MNTIYPRAIRFADLWALDHHQMVDEVYSPKIHMESMWRLDGATIEGGADLHDLENRLAALIPQHRHELVRVIAGRNHACLETTVVSPLSGEYAPACVWWWMGSNGQVDDEVGFFDWERRTADSHKCHGFVPPYDEGATGAHEELVDALRSGDLAAHVAPGCIVEAVGIGPCDLAFGPVEVQEVVVDGPVVAALIVGRNQHAVWRATVVMSTDADHRLISVRCYGDVSRAVAADSVNPAMNLGRRPTET
jgi:hypothetical protein